MTAHVQGSAVHLSQQLIQDTQTQLSVLSTLLANTVFLESPPSIPLFTQNIKLADPCKIFWLHEASKLSV